MSANKCNYSKRYWPLVEAKMQSLGYIRGGENTELKLWMTEMFENGEQVYENIASGVISNSTGSSFSARTNVNGRGQILTTETSSIDGFYTANPSAQRIMERRFKRDIVGLSIIRLSDDGSEWTWVNKSDLNKNIFNYKLELLHKLEDELQRLNEDGVSKSITSDYSELEDLIVDRCKRLRSRIDAKEDVSNEGYDVYVTLANFDKLLEQLTPFISIKKGRSDIFDDSRYEYLGPKAKMFTTFTSGKNADFASSEEQVGSLAKILLDVIPEFGFDGKSEYRIQNSGIGLSGFDSAMTAIKNAIIYGDLRAAMIAEIKPDDKNRKEKIKKINDLIDSYYDGIGGIRLREIIDAYINTLGSSAYNKYDQRRTYLLSKLRGIRNIICNPNTPADIKNLFYGLFYKTEATEYRGYNEDGAKDLKASFIESQKYFIQDLVNGAISRLKHSDELKNTLQRNYDIKIASSEISIKTKDGRSIVIDYVKKNGKVYFNLQNADAVDDGLFNELLLNILSYIAPDSYESCLPSKSNGTLMKEDFSELIGFVLIGGYSKYPGFKSERGRYSLIEIADTVQSIANRLSIIYGADTKNVVRSLSGSKLPLYQLTALNFNVQSLLNDFRKRAQLEKEKSGGRESQFIYSENLIYKNSNILGHSKIRSDVSINGVDKGVADLKTHELLQIAVVDDFLNSMQNGKIYLQNATFADKGTHFLQEYLIDETILIEDENGELVETNLRNLISSIIDSKNETDLEKASKTVSELVRKLRAAKINTVVKNIIDDYEAVFGQEVLYGGHIGVSTTTSVSLNSIKLKKIDSFLKNKSKSEISKAFKDKGIKCYEEIHFYSPKNKSLGGLRFNETILNWHETFNSPSKWNKRVLANKKQFVEMATSGSPFRINVYTNKSAGKFKEVCLRPKSGFDKFYDTNSGDIFLVKDGKLHPIVEAFFMMDMLLSNEFNSLTIGEIYAHPNKNSDLGSVFTYARQSTNGFEVSTAAAKEGVVGDSRFSAFNAKFKKGTIIDGVDVSNRSIEDVYQHVIKKSGKGLPPAQDSKLYNTELKTREDLENFSYYNGYLPLWQEWAEQNPELIDQLKTKANGKVLTDKFASGLVSQARALADILNNSSDDYYEFSEANRLIAQIKRSVIFGATIHPFAQNVIDDDGINRGVASNIAIAVIEDMEGIVWNISGLEDGIDSMDGSGFQLQIQSRLENNSLLDASVGESNKKTILADNDPMYGRPTLLKWAVYALTNEVRQNGYASVASAEQLVKKMMSKAIDLTNVNIAEEYNSYGKKIYFKDFKTKRIYRIDSINKNSNGTYSRTLTDANGNTEVVPFGPLDNLYRVDQLFGGAWAGEMIDGKFVYTDANNDMLEQIVCKYNLKDKFIAYAVNKSAIKVGSGEVNSSDVFTNPNEELRTITMSTKYGGIQMDADHDLDEAEVTEMTQMISALIEDGHYTSLVTEIYTEIGQILEEKLKGFLSEVHNYDKKQELYVRLAKSLIEAFNSGSKSTIGLAQAFLRKAEQSLSEGDFTFKVPFSAATINGAFISDVAATINKRGIRHKYEGFAGVLNPSFNMLQFYRVFDGTQYRNVMFEELADMCADFGYDVDHIKELGYVDPKTKQWVDNPFVEKNISPDDINFEDTIVITKNGISKTVTIDSLWKYDSVRNRGDFNGTVISRITSAPRNLSQGRVEFNINAFGETRTFNLYNLDTVRAAYYLSLDADGKLLRKLEKEYNNKTEALVEYNRLVSFANRVYGKYEKNLSKLNTSDLKRKLSVLNKETQRITKAFDYAANDLRSNSEISGLSQFDASEVFGLPEGTKVYATKSWMKAHECITGKYQWEKLGLGDNDKMSDILSKKGDYFKDKLKDIYSLPIISVSGLNVTADKLYDAVLYRGGEKYLVKFGEIPDEFNLTSDPTFLINPKRTGTDDDVLVGEDYVFNSDGKKFFVFTDSNNVQHHVISVDSKEAFEDLLNSDFFDSAHRYHFSENRKSAINNFMEDWVSDWYSGKLKFSINELNDIEAKRLDREIDRLAEDRYEAFVELQHYVGARIPTQAMQSFMPMEVVAVTNCKTNQIYVPRVQTWLEGSDYDIDKLYILIHTIDKNGKISSGSGLQNIYGFNITKQLSKPNGKHYEVGDNGMFIDRNTVLKLASVTRKSNGSDIAQFVDILNDIFSKDTNVITFEAGTENDVEYDRAKTKLIRILNKHSKTNPRVFNSDNAIKNRIVDKTNTLVTSPQNQKSASVPINMDEQHEAASRSTLGAIEKHLSSDNAAAKFFMQEQTMVGKEVIGITAVSLKTFFALSSYYNGIIQEAIDLLSTDVYGAIDKIRTLLIENPINGVKTVLSNIDLERFIDAAYLNGIDLSNYDALSIGEFFEDEYENSNLLNSLRILNDRCNRTDAALTISGLLSAATDNVKELILAKINANPELVDVYTYLAMIGNTFEEIADIMLSKEFATLSGIVSENIFDTSTYGYKIKDGIDFMLNEELLHGIDDEVLRTALVAAGLTNDYAVDEDGREYRTGKKKILEILSNDSNLSKLTAVVKTSIAASRNSGDDDIDDPDRPNRPQLVDFARRKRIDLYRALERYQLRNDFFKERKFSFNDLTKISKVLDGVNEMSILGGLLGINQGTKTNMYDQYSYVSKVNNFINSRIKRTSTPKEVKALHQDFNLYEFLQNDLLKASWLETYNNWLKTSFPILDVITTVPHFSKMINTVEALHTALSRCSSKYRMTIDLANALAKKSGKSQIGKKEFQELERYVNDKLIAGFLLNQVSSAPNFKFEFTIRNGQTYYKGFSSTDVAHGDKLIKMESVWDLFTFKRYMEDYVIPRLKSQYPGNQFIGLLGYTEESESYRGQKRTYYKLPLNMNTIEDSPNTEAIYNNILIDFNTISKDSFEGNNIGDLFYLYNMIVNKDSFGDHTLTRIFENLVDAGRGSSVISSFNAWLSYLDFESEEGNKIENFLYNLDGNVSNETIEEANYRVRKAVTSSTLKPIKGSKLDGTVLTEDGTLDLPKTFNISITTDTDVKSVPNLNSVINFDSIEITHAIIDRLNSIYHMAGVEDDIVIEIDDSDFESDGIFSDRPELKDVNAFILNGNVYINMDHAKWNHALHEFAHLILASIRVNDLVNKTDKYYTLLSKVQDWPGYESVKQSYMNKFPDMYHEHSLELDEEVFCIAVEQSLQELSGRRIKQLDENGNVSMLDNLLDITKSDTVFEALQSMLDLKDVSVKNLKGLDIEQIIRLFSSQMFVPEDDVIDDSIVMNQALKRLKSDLLNGTKDNKLEEVCDPDEIMKLMLRINPPF